VFHVVTFFDPVFTTDICVTGCVTAHVTCKFVTYCYMQLQMLQMLQIATDVTEGYRMLHTKRLCYIVLHINDPGLLQILCYRVVTGFTTCKSPGLVTGLLHVLQLLHITTCVTEGYRCYRLNTCAR
jgi:hypothetical protein